MIKFIYMRSHSYIGVHFIGLVCSGPVLLILVYCTLLHKPTGRKYGRYITKHFHKKPNPNPPLPSSIPKILIVITF